MTKQVHPEDEDFAPVHDTWTTPISLAEARAPTKPIKLELLNALLERCREDE